MKKGFDQIILVVKHPTQSIYQELSEYVEILTYLQLKNKIFEKDFIEKINLSPERTTAVIFDDVILQFVHIFSSTNAKLEV